MNKLNSGILLIAVLSVILVAGCSFSGAGSDPVEQARIRSAVEHAAVIVDVRTPAEFSLSHYDGAINIPYDQIVERASELEEFRNQQVVLYCRSGRRSGIALSTLNNLGFSKVVDAGGFKMLKKIMAN